MSGSSGLRRIMPWAAVALLGVTAGLLFAVMLAAPGDTPAVVARVGGEPSDTVPAAQTLTDAQAPASQEVVAVAQPATPHAALSDGSRVADPPSFAPADTAVTAGGLRLSIPSLAVDASIVDLGFNGDGQLDVPGDGVSVGWYDVSPRPGEPGNALLGGHYDWDGSLAVFWRLGELQPGDRVQLDDAAGVQLVYEVRSTTSVGWDQSLSEILAGDDGSSLTLFTCGGEFDQTRGEYAQRVVVRATLVEPSSLASRR